MQPCTLRFDVPVWSLAIRRRGVVTVSGVPQHAMLKTIAHIASDVEAALIWFGGPTYALMRGRPYLATQTSENDGAYTET